MSGKSVRRMRETKSTKKTYLSKNINNNKKYCYFTSITLTGLHTLI